MSSEKMWPKKYKHAARLLDEIGTFRKAWENVQPPAPFKKGDIMLLGMMLEKEKMGEGPLTAKKLAQMLKQTPPGISQRINALVDMGMISRQADENDRRVMFISLTAKGRSIAEDALEHMLEQLSRALDVMGKEDTKQLLSLLHTFSDAMQEVIEKGGNRN